MNISPPPPQLSSLLRHCSAYIFHVVVYPEYILYIPALINMKNLESFIVFFVNTYIFVIPCAEPAN